MARFFKKKVVEKKTFLQNVVEFVLIAFLIFCIRTFIFGLYIVPTGSMEPTMLVGARFFADKLSYFLRKPARGDIIAFNDPEFRYSKNKLVTMFQHYVWGPANWTKRVIGVPGDEVRGAIEGEKPVIYLNGKKLDEPHINPYPLIHVWTKSIGQIQQDVQKELQKYAHVNQMNQMAVNNLVARKLSCCSTWRTYDPSVSFEDQPFYKLSESRVARDEKGDLELLYPETPFYKTVDKKEKRRGDGEFWNGSDEFYVKLRDGEYWCMGDNRRGSKDCRVFGPIKETFIHGRILFQIFSIDNDDNWSTWLLIDLALHPIEFFKRIRWHDFFKWVR
jgi:signal peptidase I